jgi:hypothetical protein
MFPGEEWVTVFAALIFVAISAGIYFRTKHIAPALWTVSAICFLLISIALATMGLNALQLSVTPYLGSLYPGLLATGIIASQSRFWRYYLAFVVLLLILMAVGSAGSEALSRVSRVLLHSISGLVIVLLPVVFASKKLSPPSAILVSIGGLLISVGGLALATLMAGKPLLPFETVVYLLHPLLFMSAFVMAAGLYISKGLGLRTS